MSGRFILAKEAEREKLNWGELAWLSRPSTTEAKDLVVIEVKLAPGGGHNFHKHPEQEEVIYVIEGTVEQWLRQEKRMLGPGDSVFIPADTVHASFNTSKANAKLIAILGPCVGKEGYQLVDVSDQAPWKTQRQPAKNSK
jgi:quercetin dioxygenase-like cupin family protein